MKGDANDRIERELRAVKTVAWLACVIGAANGRPGWPQVALLFVCFAGWAISYIRK